MMGMWDSAPDPYKYEKLPGSVPWAGDRHPYLVTLDGEEIGVIVPVTINTDRKAGRLRIPGKGAPGFAAVVPARHSFSGTLLGHVGKHLDRDRRRDAANDLVSVRARDEAFTGEFLARSIAHYRKDRP